MKLGIVKEIRPDERRVAAAPSTVGKWVKAGWEVVVEAGAGAGASFPDHLYTAAGATVLDTAAAVWSQADVVCKVRLPGERPDGTHEADSVREGQVLISFIYPAQNKALVDRLLPARRRCWRWTASRASAAQKVDALSSMANISGYRAIVEAAQKFGSFFTGQITAAGKVAPAGRAGDRHRRRRPGRARRRQGPGAIVRAFDARAAAADQVKSMGAEF
jgi:NAD(P) transhydrogenase subunit alpha